MRLLLCFAIGLIFGTGIIVSGMINPMKIVNFFDVAGLWDPSLIFVMGGAVAVAFVGYRLAWHHPAPLLDPVFHLPTARRIDQRLVGGAALFGIGWGITGFCPGGSLPAVGTLDPDVLIFVAAMTAGILAVRLWRRG